MLETKTDLATPALPYAHRAGDIDINLLRIHQAMMTACRPIEWQGVREVSCFAALTSNEWVSPGFGPVLEHNRFSGLDDEAFVAKRSALNAYAAEMREGPHVRSWEAVSVQAALCGAAAGMLRPEAFFVSRWLVS